MSCYCNWSVALPQNDAVRDPPTRNFLDHSMYIFLHEEDLHNKIAFPSTIDKAFYSQWEYQIKRAPFALCYISSSIGQTVLLLFGFDDIIQIREFVSCLME